MNDGVKVHDIDYQLEKDVKYKHDLENSTYLEDRKNLSNSGTDDKMNHLRLRRAEFGGGDDSDEDEEEEEKKIKGTQGTIAVVFP